MQIKHLKLLNFKNYVGIQHEFSEGINLIVGPNGSGKTNLLDAVHVLSTSRGAFNHIDSQHIRWGEQFFTLKAELLTSEGKQYDLQCSVERGKKKLLACDGKEYEKISDHYGRFPAVLVAPYDTDLVREGSEIRRKFFDSIIAQLDRKYLSQLSQYQNILRQRNEAIRKMAESRRIDHALIEAYNAQLLPLNQQIMERRSAFLEQFLPIFLEKHQQVSEGKETVKISYRSEVQEDTFEADFLKNFSRDLTLMRTELGIHRDKYTFEISRRSLKKYGSQGQQKTFVLALKLAQFEIIRQEKNKTPLLLLDDIFDKLDTRRTERLIELIREKQFGQVFITDATPDRALALFQNLSAKVISTQDGP
ncbi:MAG: DNA replication and repair protein RecF [Bacteroidota bacterium]